MSLKSFHLFFLAVAVLFDFALAAFSWLGPDNSITHELRTSGMGVGSGIFGLALTVYGIWFMRRKAPKIII
ncbi:MAG: hypothetical protein JWM59_1319 [Verrucomicrobiales bacterium]|nr:hypothetical protein [Verrucomicrobiales bacterium]